MMGSAFAEGRVRDGAGRINAMRGIPFADVDGT